MKTLWRSVIFYAGIVLTVATPVQGEIASKLSTTPLPSTDTPTPEVVAQGHHSTEYQTAYDQGQREAQENIAMGKPSIYTVGLWRPNSPAVDQETGLPLVPIAGCVVDDSIMGRMNGYNDRIKEWAAQQSTGVKPPQSTSDSQKNSPPKTTQVSSGITGRLTLTTMPGTIQIGVNKVQPIISPLRVPIAVFDRTGRQVTTTQPDAQGYFRIALKPGTYKLKPIFPKSNRAVEPIAQSDREQVVTVKPQQFTSIQFNYTSFAP